MKAAVSLAAPFVESDAPIPTASLDPNESNSITFGMCSSSRSFTSWLHITPDELISASEERSHLPGFASSACTIGRANASPTMISELTCRSWQVRHSSPASNLRSGRVTTEPPRFIVMSDENCPVPCISGHADIVTGSGAPALTLTRSRSPASAGDEIGARPSNG